MSIWVCLLLYDFAYLFIDSNTSKVLQSFIIIGPVEELAKLFTLLVLYRFIRKQIDEPVDGMIYMACIALGFSLIENYFYATRTPDSSHLIFLRLFLSTPSHITDSILMGLGFYVWIQRSHRYGLLLAALIYASLIHGLFDGVIFMDNEWSDASLLVVMGISLMVGITALNFGTAISPFRPTLKEFLKTVSQPESAPGLVCSHCGDEEEKQLFNHQYFVLQKCTSCDKYLLDYPQLSAVYSYFTSTVLERKEFIEYFGDRDETNHHELDELHDILEEVRLRHIETYTGRWLPKRLFRPPVNDE